jgi:Recombinase zinc beta ribbon domain
LVRGPEGLAWAGRQSSLSMIIRTVDHVFALKDLLSCTFCGSTLPPFGVQKKHGKKIFYYWCRSTQLYRSRCPLRQCNAGRFEQLVEEKLTEMENRQGFLEELIASIDLKTEEETGPLLREKRGLDGKLREVKG